jgi:hypothetical protein
MNNSFNGFSGDMLCDVRERRVLGFYIVLWCCRRPVAPLQFHLLGRHALMYTLEIEIIIVSRGAQNID